MQALGELAVLYPENGAFTAYIIRFIDVCGSSLASCRKD